MGGDPRPDRDSHALEEGTFFAKLVVRQGDALVEVDARPSDAIALGAAARHVRIFVAESVLEEASSEPIRRTSNRRNIRGGCPTSATPRTSPRTAIVNRSSR